MPTGLILAAGGITYPLYLLYMQMGYMIFTAVAPVHHVELWTAAIISGAVILAWATWRFVERPVHSLTKNTITVCANRLGLASHLRTEPQGEKSDSPVGTAHIR